MKTSSLASGFAVVLKDTFPLYLGSVFGIIFVKNCQWPAGLVYSTLRGMKKYMAS
jgi:hypothetical protein